MKRGFTSVLTAHWHPAGRLASLQLSSFDSPVTVGYGMDMAYHLDSSQWLQDNNKMKWLQCHKESRPRRTMRTEVLRMARRTFETRTWTPLGTTSTVFTAKHQPRHGLRRMWRYLGFYTPPPMMMWWISKLWTRRDWPINLILTCSTVHSAHQKQ